MKQIYGFTRPETATTGYTGFLIALVEDDGSISIQVRQHEGEPTPKFISLPPDEAAKLARAIYREKKAREGGDAQD